jgi:hypothetical protein
MKKKFNDLNNFEDEVAWLNKKFLKLIIVKNLFKF